MLNVAALLDRCAAAGVQLSVRGDALAVRPASRLDPALRAELSARKPEVIAWLTAPCAVCGQPADPTVAAAAPWCRPYWQTASDLCASADSLEAVVKRAAVAAAERFLATLEDDCHKCHGELYGYNNKGRGLCAGCWPKCRRCGRDLTPAATSWLCAACLPAIVRDAEGRTA